MKETGNMAKLEKIKSIKKTRMRKRLRVVAICLIIVAALAVKNSGEILRVLNNGASVLDLNSALTENDSNTSLASSQPSLSGSVKPMVSAGQHHSLILKADGTVFAMGYNAYGQLGNITLANKATYSTEIVPVWIKEGQEQLSNIKKIAAGYNHNVALSNDGEVYTWGYNGYGQLGNGNTKDTSIPTKITTNAKIVDICGWVNNTLLLDENGVAYVVGQNYTDTLTKVDIDEKITQISGNLILTENQNVYEIKNLATPISGLKNVEKVYTGYLGTSTTSRTGLYMALTSEGKIYTWGKSSYGEAGTGANGTISTPTFVKMPDKTEDMTGIVEVVVGRYNVMALDKNGKIYTWGYNNYSQLGNGNATNQSLPVEITDLPQIASLGSSQYYHSIILDKNGFVWTTGYNGYGQLGIGNTTTRTTFTKLGNSYLEFTDRQKYIKVGETSPTTITAKEGFNVYDASISLAGMSYQSSNENVATVDSNGNITAKARGKATITATNQEGDQARCIVYVISNKNNTITLPSVTVTLGGTTAILREDGTVWTAGNNANYTLGIGTEIGATNPEFTQVKISEDEYLTDIVKIAEFGNASLLALTKNGEVYSWGSGANKVLGLGNDTKNKEYATKIPNLNNIIDIEMTEFDNAKALTKDGEVYTWGSNPSYDYQVGDTFGISGTPQKLTTIDNVVDISTGNFHILYLKSDGTVWANGHGTYGQLGVGSTSSSTVPVQVKMTNGYLKNVSTILANDDTSAIINSDGDLWAWGDNDYRQLGNNSTTDATLPIKVNLVSGTKAVTIGGANDAISYIANDGKVYVIGYNNKGQLAQGNANNVTTWKTAKTSDGQDITGAFSLTKGEVTSSFIIKQDGSIWSCGYNANGQLGTGDKTDIYYYEQIGKAFTEFKDRNKFIKVGETVNTSVEANEGLNAFRDLLSTNGMTYKSANTNVAKVDNSGNITGVATGETTIIATNENGEQARCIVYVIRNNDKAITIPSVSTTNNGAVAILKEDGTVWTAGNNANYTLGRGKEVSDNKEFKQVKVSENEYLTNIIKISESGNGSFLALTKTGEVYAWGYGSNFTLGLGTDKTNKEYATKIPNLKNIIDVETTSNYNAKALTKDGEVYTWGGTNTTTFQTGDNLIGISGTPQKVKVINNVIDISSGYASILYLKGDGTVWANGLNSNGQLGVGNTTDSQFPVQVKINSTSYLENISTIKSIDRIGTAIDENGNLYFWGANNYYQLGTGNSTDVKYATKATLVDGTKAIDVGGGYYSTSYVADNGLVYTIGCNNYGQLGQNNEANVTKWATAKNKYGENITGAMSISKGSYYSNFIIKQDGSIWTAGYNGYGQLGLLDTTSRNYFQEVGEAYLEFENRQTYVKAGEKIQNKVKVHAGFNVYDNLLSLDGIKYKSNDENIVKIDENGYITGIQRGETSITVTNSNGNQARAIVYVISNNKNAITMPDVSQTLDGTTAILKEDGTVWTAGNNANYALGRGTTVSDNTEFAQVKISETEYLTNVIKISEEGEASFLALTKNGEVYSWGYGAAKTLGFGADTKNKEYATKIPNLKDIIDVDVTAYNNAKALTKNGEVYTWGSNSNYEYQLGDSITNDGTPQKITLINNVIDISNGCGHILYLKGDGTVWANGYNAQGQLGNGTKSNSNAPVQVKTGSGTDYLKNISKIATAYHNSGAIDDNGNLYLWGINNYYQLGNNNTTDATIATKVTPKSGTKVLKVGGGYRFLLYETDDGKIYGSGYNANGELSQNNTTNVKTWTTLKTKEGEDFTGAFKLVNGTGASNIIIRQDGSVWAAGNNDHGQLGLYDTINRSYFQEVGEAYLEFENRQDYVKIGTTVPNKVKSHMGFNVFNSSVAATGITYKSSNEDIATVDQNGNVKGIKRGEATIIATNQEGKQARAIIYVISNNKDAITIPSVSTTYNGVTAILKEDGTVWTAGNNANYALGRGKEVTNNSEFEQVKISEDTYLTNIIKISENGNGSFLALTQTGEVYTWGNGSNFTLGLGTDKTNKEYATKIPNLKNIIDVETTSNYNAKALTEDGEVYTWGGTNTTTYQIGDNAVEISGTPEKINSIKNVVDISGGYASILYLKGDGTVWANGYNDDGQLGVGNTTESRVPVQVKIDNKTSYLKNITSIETTHKVGAAIDENGNLYLWGANNYYQLGTGNTNSVNIATKVNLVEGTKAVEVGGGTYFTTYIADNGKLYVQGYNGNGQLSQGDTTTLKTWTIAKNKYGEEFTEAFRLSNGTLQSNVVIKQDGSVWACGYNVHGELGLVDTTNRNYLEEVGEAYLEFENRQEFIKIDETVANKVSSHLGFNVFDNLLPVEGIEYKSSNENIAKVDENGNITGVARGEATIIATTKTGEKASCIIYVISNNPKAITMPTVSITRNGAIAILKEDGTVWTAGNNANYALGRGKTVTDNTEFAQVKISESEYLTGVVKISENGQDNFLALTEKGEVYSWGYGAAKALGFGDDTKNKEYATKIPNLKDIIDVEITGFNNAKALTKDGDVYTWGSNVNYEYQIGDNFEISGTPQKVRLIHNVIDISVGYAGILYLKGDGTVWANGLNDSGQLGNGATSNSKVPVQVKTKDGYLENIVKIEKVDEVGAAIDETGALYLWGNNEYYQLGTGNKTNLTVATKANIPEGVKAVEVGGSRCAIMYSASDGKVYTVGYNNYGQLAQNNTTNVTSWTTVKTKEGEDFTGAYRLGKNSYYSNVIIKEEGSVWGVGHNNYGQLGLIDTTSRSYLQEVGESYIEFENRQAYIKIGDTVTNKVQSHLGFNVFDEALSVTGITYKSSNENIAKVDENGNITGIARGEVTITATSTSGDVAKAIINVISNNENAITIPTVSTTRTGTIAILKEDGTVWTAGNNSNYALGRGETVTNTFEFDRVKVSEDTYLSNVVKISENGYGNFLALTKDGEVYSWGYGAAKALGFGDDTKNKAYASKIPDLKDVIDIDMTGFNNAKALTKDGQVYTWGSNANNEYQIGDNFEISGVPQRVRLIKNVIDISGGYAGILYLKGDGTVWANGLNDNGQLGNGVTTNSKVPVQVKVADGYLDKIVEIEYVDDVGSAIDEEGNLYLWGNNEYYQLGNGNKTNLKVATKANLPEGVKATEVGGSRRALEFISNDGKVYVVGYNNYGQLSQGSTSTITSWTTAKTADGAEVTEAYRLSKGSYYSNAVIKQDGSVWTVGYNAYGQLGLLDTTSRNYLEQVGEAEFTPKKYEHTIKVNESILLDKDDFEYAKDFNVFVEEIREIGNLSFESQNTDIATVDTKGNIIGIKQGLARIKVTNQLNGDITYVVVKVTDGKVEPMLAQGQNHTIALKSDGSVWGFGNNSYGQIGNINLNESKYVADPVPVWITEGKEQLTNIKKIAVGYNHSVALSNDGEVYTWGYNQYKQLGYSGTSSNKPTKLSFDAKIIDISGWQNNTIVLDENGNVYAWGYNFTTSISKIELPEKAIQISGNLILTENKKVYQANKPQTPISGLKNVIKVFSGYFNGSNGDFAALTDEGKIYAWGINSYGEAGNGATGSVSKPAYVKTSDGLADLTGIIDMNLTRYGVIALDYEGTLYGWGYNGYGQIGNNDKTTQKLPVVIDDMPEIEVLGNAGYYHNAFMDVNGFVWTVGYNANGQLGNGTNTNSAVYNMIGDLKIQASESKVRIHIGDKKAITAEARNTFNLKYDTVNTQLTYHMQDENIATYENGEIVAKSVGSTYLIIESEQLDVSTAVKVEVLPDEKQAIPSVQSGIDFSVALKADGSVWTWGNNTYGQLGNGTKIAQNEPVETDIKDIVTEISVGEYHVLALTGNGEVYSFGYNGNGRCGNGTTSAVATPVQVKTLENSKETVLKDIIKVKAGKTVSFAIDKDLNLWAWGKGYTKYAEKVANLENIIDVTQDYVLTAEGKVYKLSDNSKVLTVDKVRKLEEGYDHTVMVTEKGGAYAIGKNTYGQLGTGNTTDSLDSVVGVRQSDGETLFTNVKDVQAGNGNTAIFTYDNKVYFLGSNANSKLGQAVEVTNNVLPVEYTNVENPMLVSLGYNHTVIANGEGFVYDFGAGTLGQLGNLKNEDSINPVLVGTYNISLSSMVVRMHVNEQEDIQAKMDFFNLLLEDTEGLEYESYDDTVAKVDDEGIITGVGAGTTYIEFRQAGTDNRKVIIVEVLAENQVAKPQVETNGSHTIILKANGTVWSFGQNANGELGDGSYTTKDGTVKVQFDKNTKIVQIDAGTSHNIALDIDGNVWTWGSNSYYQLGRSSTNANIPGKVTMPEEIVKVAAGNNYSLAIGKSGKAYAWGYNANGELGVGTYKTVTRPAEIVGIENVIDISGGNNHSILATTTGEVYTTGDNTYGQLGSTGSKINLFTKVSGVENVIDVEAGEVHNIVRTLEENVYTWGSNIYGQLGLNDRQNRYVPTLIDGKTNIAEIAAGKANTMLLDRSGKVYITGLNSCGEIGDGTTDTKQEYVQVEKIPAGIGITTGETYSLAIRADGTVWAWGDYNHGAEDANSKTKSKVPVMIGTFSALETSSEIVLKTSETTNIGISAKEKFNVFYDYDKEPEDYTYESLNPEIADINAEGTIIGVQIGKTRVIATDKETGEKFSVIVTVIENTKVAVPQIDGGNGFAVTLKADGTIWTWGYNPEGALGDGTYETALIPRRANVVSTYSDIAVGKDFAIARRADGTVWAWGSNAHGQLGIGSHKNAPKLVQTYNIQNVKMIAAGAEHTVAVDQYGILYGWGSNTRGQLGLGSKDDVITPTIIATPEDSIISLAAGGDQTAYVTIQGEVYGLGNILNGKLDGIENVIQVEVGDNYLLLLDANGDIYEYSNSSISKIQGTSNVVDIVAKKHIRMYQDKDGITYNWGENTYGELGTNDTETKTVPTKVSENGENTFNIGAGYENSYIIKTDGFAYGAGRNNHGQLGNSMQEDSKVHTLVGDRDFELNPDNMILTVNDVKNIKIACNTFNVFNEVERNANDYDWISSETEVASVSNGMVVAKDMGTTTITARDKVTNVEKQALVVVMPVDEHRIDEITVNGELAKVAGDKKYSVTIASDKETATIRIETLDKTDKISIDGGQSYIEGGVLVQEIAVPDKVTNLPIKIQTSNGTIIDYTLEITRTSKNTNIQSIKVNDIDATPINATEYQVVVEEDVNEINIEAIAENADATVSINGETYQKAKAEYQTSMDELILTIPISVKSESETVATYMLTIYKKSTLVDLDSLVVNGQEAKRISETAFNSVIERDADMSTIIATTTYNLSRVSIAGNEALVHTATNIVETTEEATEVLITVTADYENEVLSREYTLTIYKERENAKIDLLIVNNTTIIPEGNTYVANLPNSSEEAEVRVVTALESDKVQIADTEEGIYDVTRTVKTPEEENTYTIVVTDGETGEKQQYTLIITKPSADTSIKEIIGENIEENYQEKAELVEPNTYELKVLDTMEEVDLKVTAGSKSAKVSIDGGAYQEEKAESTIKLNPDEQVDGVVKQVHITVEAENGSQKEYVLNIIIIDNDTALKQVTVNGIQAELSSTEENTYNLTLDAELDKVDVTAETVSPKSQVSINNGSGKLNISTETIVMDSKNKQVKIVVKAESGRIQDYYLNIYGLPNNTNAVFTVDGEEGTFVPEENKYVFRVNTKNNSHTLSAILEDNLAKVKLADQEEKLSQDTLTFTNDLIGQEITAIITAQDGTQETITIEFQAKSSDAEIAKLAVNNEILEADESGNYNAKVAQSAGIANIEIELSDENASVLLKNGEEELQTGKAGLSYDLSIAEITDKEIVLNIVVTAEDGTTKTSTLTLTILRGNTNIANITVDGNTVSQSEDGTYYYVMERKDTAEISVTAEDTSSKIEIDEEVSSNNILTKTIETPEEENRIGITITAEDGTEETYILVIRKISNDNYLQTIMAEGIDPSMITSTGVDAYEIKVPLSQKTLRITAITRHDAASVKLSTEDDTLYNLKEMTRDVTLSGGGASEQFKITVKAENGELREYTITVSKQNVLDIESVEASGEEAVFDAEKNAYVGRIDRNDRTTVSVSTVDKTTKIEILVGGKTVRESTGSVTTDIDTLEETTKIQFRVTLQDNSESKTYDLILNKKSEEAGIEIVSLDNTVLQPDEFGVYRATVPDSKDSVSVYVKAISEYAKIQINSDSNIKTGENTIPVQLNKNEDTQTVRIVVTAEDGTYETYYLVLTILGDNNALEYVKVNNIDAEKLDDSVYEYRIAPTIQNSEVAIRTEDENATIVLGEQSEKGLLELNVDTIEETTEIPFEVVSEYGTRKSYTLRIVKQSTDNSIKEIKVNDVAATKQEDGSYYISVPETLENADVTVTTNHERAMVQIESGETKLNTVTENVILENKITEVTIKTISESGIALETRLVIEKQSDETGVEIVTVDDVAVTDYNPDTHTFTTTIMDRRDQSNILIRAKSNIATIELGDVTNTGTLTTQIALEETNTEVKFTVTAENGNKQEYTLIINRLLNNTDLELVELNDIQINPSNEELGLYEEIIAKKAESAKIRVKTVDKYANIKIGDEEAAEGDCTVNLSLDLSEEVFTIPVVVTSQDGTTIKTYTIILRRGNDNTDISKLTVDSTEIPCITDIFTASVSSNQENAEVTIKLADENATVMLNEQSGKGSLTVAVPIEGKTTTKEITVIAEDGTTKTYTLVLNVLSDNNALEYVKVNNIEAEMVEDGVYESLINPTLQETPVEIKTEDENAIIVIGETGKKQLLQIDVETIEEETEFTFDVISEYGTRKTYTLRIRKQSNDNSIKEIKVNNVVATKQDDGSYYVSVTETLENANVTVVTNDDKCKVKIGEGEEGINTATEKIALEEKLTEVIIKTTSESGIPLETKLVIEKQSAETGVQIVTVDDKEVTDYNEDTHTYTITITEAKDESNVIIMPKSNVATVELGEASATGTLNTKVALEETGAQVTFKVTAENGTEQEYTLVIIRSSDNTDIDFVELNDVRIAPTNEELGLYEEIIPKNAETAKIKVKAVDKYASIKIADEEARQGESTVNLSLDLDDETITIPVVVTAQNGITIRTYNIVLRRGSDNTDIAKVTVESEEIPCVEDTYTAIVKGSKEEADVTITLADANATAMLNGASGKGSLTVTVQLEGITTTKEIKVIAEDGTTKTYTLIINKYIGIVGSVITENTEDRHIALVQVYKTSDTRPIGDEDDPRELIASGLTNEDGTFDIMVPEVDVYDVVITKPGYLDYTVTDIETVEGESSDIGEKELIAGDVVKSGQIEIDDLVTIVDNYGTVQEETQKIYDLNEDGEIDSKDRAIIKKNYDKVDVKEVWVNPEVARTKLGEKSAQTPNEKGFIKPMDEEYEITSEYGYRIHPITGEKSKHTGIDISGVHHANIYAVADGEIVYAGVQSGYGNCIEIKHKLSDGSVVYSFYGHLSKIDVKVGDKVSVGEKIGNEGGEPGVDKNAGSSTGHHLHFELRTKSEYGYDVNPEEYVDL